MLESDIRMSTQFKRIREDSVMCTVQGCADVAVFFVARNHSREHPWSAPAAYCEAHAQDAAKLLGHPWPVSDRRPVEKISSSTRYLAG